MGQMTQARVAAWQKASGIEPVEGARAERLREASQLAYDLIRAIELEISGIRDGDGYWHGSDPVGGLVLQISDRWQLSNRAEEFDAALNDEIPWDAPVDEQDLPF